MIIYSHTKYCKALETIVTCWNYYTLTYFLGGNKIILWIYLVSFPYFRDKGTKQTFIASFSEPDLGPVYKVAH